MKSYESKTLHHAFTLSEDDEENISLLLDYSIKYDIPQELISFTCPILYNLVRSAVQEWVKAKPQLISSRLSDFVLHASTFFLSLLHLIDQSRFTLMFTAKIFDKYFKLLSYPLMHCFKMSEVSRAHQGHLTYL